MKLFSQPVLILTVTETLVVWSLLKIRHQKEKKGFNYFTILNTKWSLIIKRISKLLPAIAHAM